LRPEVKARPVGYCAEGRRECWYGIEHLKITLGRAVLGNDNKELSVHWCTSELPRHCLNALTSAYGKSIEWILSELGSQVFEQSPYCGWWDQRAFAGVWGFVKSGGGSLRDSGYLRGPRFKASLGNQISLRFV